MQLSQVTDPLGDIGGITTRGRRGNDRGGPALAYRRQHGGGERQRLVHGPVSEPEHHRRRILIDLRPRGLLARLTRQQPQVPSNTSGERHSTPLSSATGKLWSPAFHFADEAPVQNHRKFTVFPSKDAFASYALNCRGATGASTRYRSAGSPSPFSIARSSSA